MSDYKVIHASEIGEYVYCNHAWWLRRVHGRTSHHVAKMAVGTAHHEEHGRTLGRSLILRKAAIAFLLSGTATLFLWLLG